MVVAVGLDETYLEAVPALAKALKAGGAKTVLVAGLLKEQADGLQGGRGSTTSSMSEAMSTPC